MEYLAAKTSGELFELLLLRRSKLASVAYDLSLLKLLEMLLQKFNGRGHLQRVQPLVELLDLVVDNSFGAGDFFSTPFEVTGHQHIQIVNIDACVKSSSPHKIS